MKILKSNATAIAILKIIDLVVRFMKKTTAVITVNTNISKKATLFGIGVASFIAS